MKLINSNKEVDEFVCEPELEHFSNFDEEENQHGPCFEVKIDRKEKNVMTFLIDNEEKLSCPLSQLDDSFFTVEKISELIQFMRVGDFKTLRKILRIRRR